MTWLFYVRNTSGMSVRREVKKVGGSLGVLIPRDIAESMNVKAGSEVRLTLVGRQMVIEPVEDAMDDDTFRRALAAVLRRDAKAFAGLAAYDRGEAAKPKPRRS